MGRVYKALVKAERWKEADRPIGRPHRKETAQTGDGKLSPRFPFNVSLDSQTDYELNKAGNNERPPQVPPVSFRRELADVTAATVRPRLDVGLTQSAVPQPSEPSEPVKPFEEPLQVLNLQELAIDSRVAALINENPLAIERYRSLSVKLLNVAERRRLKTLMITSAESGEGKTVVATVVAWFLAKRAERRVLLIDANTTSPSVGRALGLDPKRGWLNLVQGFCEPKDAIIRIGPNGLYVMTPGPLALEPTDAMSSRLEDEIGKLAPHFDLVVVDSSAILESPESQRLAAVLDGTVIVARAGFTHHSKVTAARKLVPKERRLGVVLNESEALIESAVRRPGKSSLVGRLFGRKK